MRIFHGFDDLPRFTNPVVTMGSYDGVHLGHRKLIRVINDIARDTGGESVLVTFSPHPREVLSDGGNVKLLSSPCEKLLLLREAGIQNLIIAPFTKEFSEIPSRDFAADYLAGKIGAATLVVGYNHHFGRNKTGNFNSLRTMGSELGFRIHMIPRHDVEEEKVSSTIIRNLIREGELRKAAKYLGYRYFIIARVQEDGSLTPDSPSKLLPPAGKYGVTVSAHCAGPHADAAKPGARTAGDARYDAEIIIAADGTMRLSPAPCGGRHDCFLITFI